MPKRKIAESRQKHALGEGVRDKSYLSYLSLEGVSVGEGFFNIVFTPSPKYFEWGRSLHEFVTEFSNNVTPHRSGVAQS